MRRALARTAATTTTTVATVTVAVALALAIGVLTTSTTTVAAAALSVADDTNLPYSLGPWLSATASAATVSVLDDALRLAHQQQQQHHPGALHLDPATPRICFDHVTAIEQQIVDGINFRFHVTGCALRHVESEFVGLESPPPPRSGRCPYACGAQEEAFRVTVFCQPWSHTTQVLGIEREAAATL